MATNASIEYALANLEYLKAKTQQEKLLAMKKLIATAPKHKSAEKLNAQLKRRYAQLKKDIEHEKKSGRGKSFAIRKEGAATVVFVGLPDCGKTKLFSQLTGHKYAGENNYQVLMRMIPYENVWLQGIDLPSLHAGIADSPGSGQLFDLIRNSDIVIIFAKSAGETDLIKAEFEKRDVIFDQKVKIIVSKNIFDVEKLRSDLWARVRKIRVRTRTRGVTAPKPVILNIGATVKQLAETVHKDFLLKFKHAKIWGPSARFAGQQVGFEHRLADGDIVEIFTK